MADKELSNSLNKKFNLIYILLVLLIIFFGIFVRTKVYLLNAPFWLDECMLSHSFIDRNIWDFFNSLDCQQKSPPLFLLSTFIIVKLFGFNEYCFRLIPFLSSIFSMIGFYFLLKQILKNKIGILIGLFLFAISVQSIYYAAEFKSYSLDLLVCILLLLSYKHINLKNLSFLKTVLYTVISILLTFFSYTAAIIIIAMIAAKSLEDKKISKSSILILLGFVLTYIYFRLSDVEVNDFMEHYWFYGFSLFSSIIDSFVFLLNNYTGYFKICFSIMLCCSFYVLYKEKSNYFLLMLFLFVVPIFTSIFKMYPFKERLVLYLLPILIILTVKLFELESIKKKFLKIIISIIMYSILILLFIKIPYISINEIELVDRYKDRDRALIERQNIKNITLFIIDNFNNGDKILASDEFIYFIDYYKKRYNINKEIIFNNYDSLNKKRVRYKIQNLAKSFIEENKNKSKLWIVGRDWEPYFISCLHKEVEDLLKKNKLEYDMILSYNKEAFIIYTQEKDN